MFEQKNTKQGEQNIVYKDIRLPEVTEDDPLAPYRKHLDQFDLSESEKLEYVQAVRAIVNSLFDQHFKFNHLLLNDKRSENTLDCHVPSSNLEPENFDKKKKG